MYVLPLYTLGDTHGHSASSNLPVYVPRQQTTRLLVAIWCRMRSAGQFRSPAAALPSSGTATARCLLARLVIGWSGDQLQYRDGSRSRVTGAGFRGGAAGAVRGCPGPKVPVNPRNIPAPKPFSTCPRERWLVASPRANSSKRSWSNTVLLPLACSRLD
jgi:hypothetical protein